MKGLGRWIVWIAAVVLLVGAPALVLAQGLEASSAASNLAGEGAYSLLAAFYLPRLMEWLKQQAWFGLLKRGEYALNRGVALVTAFLTALSVHYSFSHGADGWQFIIGGPHQSVIGFVGQVLAQFGIQEQVYLWMRAGGIQPVTGTPRKETV